MSKTIITKKKIVKRPKIKVEEIPLEDFFIESKENDHKELETDPIEEDEEHNLKDKPKQAIAKQKDSCTPSVEQSRTNTNGYTSLKESFTPQEMKRAVVLSEVIGPPLCKRRRERRTRRGL